MTRTERVDKLFSVSVTNPETIKPGQVYESCQPTFIVDGEPIHTRLLHGGRIRGGFAVRARVQGVVLAVSCWTILIPVAAYRGIL